MSQQLSEQIKFVQQALNDGFSFEQIAASVGTTARVIQTFCEKHNLRPVVDTTTRTVDDIYDSIEMANARKLQTAVAHTQDPAKLLQIARIVNGLKRRSNPADTPNPTERVVRIQVPRAVATRFVYSERNEALAFETDGKRVELETATKAQLDGLLLERKDAKQIQAADVLQELAAQQ